MGILDYQKAYDASRQRNQVAVNATLPNVNVTGARRDIVRRIPTPADNMNVNGRVNIPDYKLNVESYPTQPGAQQSGQHTVMSPRTDYKQFGTAPTGTAQKHTSNGGDALATNAGGENAGSGNHATIEPRTTYRDKAVTPQKGVSLPTEKANVTGNGHIEGDITGYETSINRATQSQYAEGDGTQQDTPQPQANVFAADKSEHYNDYQNQQQPAKKNYSTPDKFSKEMGHVEGIDGEVNEALNKNWRDYATAKEEKNNRSRLAILAIGDALRHIGNLYYTTKGATPQQFNSPVADEYNRQKTEQKEKKAAELAKQQLEYKKSQDALENTRKQHDSDRNDILAGVKVNEEKRKQGLYPYEIKQKENAAKLAEQKYQTEKAVSGDKVREQNAKADRAEQQAKDQKLIDAAHINQMRASAYASTQSGNASKSRNYLNNLDAADKQNSSYQHFVHADDSKMWAIPKSEVKRVEAKLKAKAKEKWAKERKDMTGKVTPYSDAELLSIALSHEEDPEIQKIYSKYGKEVKSNLTSSAGYSLK